MATNGTEIALDPRLARKPPAAILDAPSEITGDFALAPLVDKIAYSIARGLVVAVKELEDHIAAETHKVAENVDRRLDSLQSSIQDLSRFVNEQRSTNSTVHADLEKLAAGIAESEKRHAA